MFLTVYDSAQETAPSESSGSWFAPILSSIFMVICFLRLDMCKNAKLTPASVSVVVIITTTTTTTTTTKLSIGIGRCYVSDPFANALTLAATDGRTHAAGIVLSAVVCVMENDLRSPVTLRVVDKGVEYALIAHVLSLFFACYDWATQADTL